MGILVAKTAIDNIAFSLHREGASMSSPMSNTIVPRYITEDMKVEAKHMETQCKAPPLAPFSFFIKYRNPGSCCVESAPFQLHPQSKSTKKKKQSINTKFIKTSGIRGRIRWQVSHQGLAEICSVFLADPIPESTAFKNPACSTEISQER